DIGGAGALANDFSAGDPINAQDIDLSTNDNATFRLPGYGGTIKDGTAIANYLKGRNTNSGATTVSVSFGAGASSGYTGGAACTSPNLGGLSVGDVETASASPISDEPAWEAD